MLSFVLVLKCIVCCNFFVKGTYIQEKILNEDFGTNVTLPCYNDENEVIKWEKQGKVAKQILPNGDLFLNNVQKNDSGLYQCSTANEDFLLSKIRLNVRTPPPALKNITIIPSTVFALIQWRDIDDNGGYPITDITIRYKEVNSEQWQYLHPVSLNRPQTDVFKLNPNSSYFFQIWATNKLGRGEVTNVTVKTLHNNQEIELARHLLVGAETFDARIWLIAVAVVMTTLLILALGICVMTYRDCHITIGTRPHTDSERIELIPNVILNPGYYEEMKPSSQVTSQNTDEEEDEGDEELTTIYFACRNGAKAIDV